MIQVEENRKMNALLKDHLELTIADCRGTDGRDGGGAQKDATAERPPLPGSGPQCQRS